MQAQNRNQDEKPKQLKDAIKQAWPQMPDNVRQLPVQKPDYECDVCDDMGLVRKDVPVDHPDFGKAFTCPNPDCPTARENRMRALRKRLKLSGIRAKFRQWSFETFDALPEKLKKGKMTARLAMQMQVERRTHAWALNELYTLLPEGPKREKCRELYRNETHKKHGVLLYGTNGTLKTTLMACAAQEILKGGTPALMRNGLEILSAIKATFEDGGTDDLMYDLKTVDHLFMDELTFEPTGWRIDVIQEITRYRAESGRKPMVFSTNLGLEALEEYFTAQVVTGILDDCHVIEVGGQVVRHEHHDVQEVW